MQLGSLNNRMHSQTGIARTPTTLIPQEKVEAQLNSMLNRWNYPAQEGAAVKQCFLKSWVTEEAKNYPDTFAKKQSSLLQDMDNYPDLRLACSDLTPVNSSACDEKVFPMFLELQDKLREIMTNTSTWDAMVAQPKAQLKNKNTNLSLDSYRALQNQLRTELGWQGRTYNKNSPPEELIPLYKSQPYISITGVPLLNLNEDVCFLPQKPNDPTTKKIVCRHFAAQFIKETLEDKSGKGKVNLIPYSTKESIAQHIPIDIETTCNTFINNGKRYDLINNTKFGEQLCAYFLDMGRTEKQETLRAFFLDSTDHVMAFILRIKETKEDPVYVVLFYDANRTNVTVRAETKDLSTLKNYSLKHFMNGFASTAPGLYEEYYRGVEPVSLLTECNLASLTEKVTKQTKVLENFVPGILTSTHICFLLSSNFAGDLAALRGRLQEIAKTSPEKLFDLLTAKTVNGTPGLNMALQEGHADAIEAYGKLFQLFPQDEQGKRVDLLAAKRADGAPGLFTALQNGHADAVKAYGELLQRSGTIDRGRLIEVLAAKLSNGTPGLFMALQHGHADVVREYGKLLPKNDLNALIRLIAAKTANGVPGLFIALEQGCTNAVEAYGELLQLLPSMEYKVLAELLAAKEPHGIPGLFIALHDGHANAVSAYGKLLHLLPKTETGKLVELIAAKHGDVPGLLLAIQNGHVDAIKEAYAELFQLLYENELRQLFNLLEAHSTFQLSKGWNSRDRNVMDAHKKLLQWISVWRAGLIMKK